MSESSLVFYPELEAYPCGLSNIVAGVAILDNTFLSKVANPAPNF